MRVLALTALLSLPIAAGAQTPSDIARQLWPLSEPASLNAAPSQAASGGAFSGLEIARLARPAALSGSVNAAPAQPAGSGAFTPRDLASLRGRQVPAFLPEHGTAYAAAGRN